MNILHISSRSDIGGGPKALLNLLVNLNSDEINFYSAIPFNGEYAQDIQKFSVDTVEIPYRKFNISTLLKLKNYINENKISIIHSHGRGAGIYSRLLRFTGVKVIHTFHGVHDEGTFKCDVKLVVDRFLAFLTDYFICVSLSEKEKAIRCHVATKDKIKIIPNSVALTKRKNKPQNKLFTFGYLARLDKAKGIDILIDYIDRYTKLHKDELIIKIAGEGPEEKYLRDKLLRSDSQKQIEFIGQVLDPLDFLNSLDGYLSFSRAEGLPFSVLEAMSMGIPCLLSDVVGNRDLVETGVNGLLFDLSSYKDFEKKITKFIYEHEARSVYKLKSFQKISLEYSHEIVSKKTMEIYKL